MKKGALTLTNYRFRIRKKRTYVIMITVGAAVSTDLWANQKKHYVMQWIQDARAMFNHKCAECHEGDMFPTGAFSFNKPFDMHERCPKCNANYYPEPGFYYGAMFMSYIFSAFIILGFVMVLHWILKLSLMASFGWLMIVVAVFFVWWFRFARAFWLNLIVGFKPEKKAIAKAK